MKYVVELLSLRNNTKAQKYLNRMEELTQTTQTTQKTQTTQDTQEVQTNTLLENEYLEDFTQLVKNPKTLNNRAQQWAQAKHNCAISAKK